MDVITLIGVTPKRNQCLSFHVLLSKVTLMLQVLNVLWRNCEKNSHESKF
jgi:hypothetical protein